MILCPPMKISGPEFVGMKVSKLKEALEETLEIPEDSTVQVSKDKGKTFKKEKNDYVVEDMDVVEFGRGSSRKGNLFSLKGRSMRVLKARFMSCIRQMA